MLNAMLLLVVMLFNRTIDNLVSRTCRFPSGHTFVTRSAMGVADLFAFACSVASILEYFPVLVLSMTNPGAPIKAEPATPYQKLPVPYPSTLCSEADCQMPQDFLGQQGALFAPSPSTPMVTGPAQAIVSRPSLAAP